jgi:argininosuccinate synthase
MPESVVLAFSGGLDTSYCLWQLKQAGFTVHTVFVDTGGVTAGQAERIESRARELGADRHHKVDASQDIWDEFVVPLVWSHARTLDQYPMLCSDRYVIVRKSLEVCDAIGTRNFAHGCTGMGNDQLRFDQTVRSLGDYNIMAPIRDLQSRTRQVRDYEIEQLRKAGFEVPVSNSRYSINENILGVTVSGGAIDKFAAPDDDTWQLCKRRQDWPQKPLQLRIGFEKGVAKSLDGKSMTGPDLLRSLNRALGDYGIGRHIYTGDVTIGLKGRIVFECPGITGLLTAHRALEDTINTRFQNQFRHIIAARWGELVYAGFFYEPHRHDLQAYLASSQRFVTGTVTLWSEGGNLLATAIDSPHILHNKDAVYAQSCSWTPEEAVGFIKLLGQSSTLSARVNGVITNPNSE